MVEPDQKEPEEATIIPCFHPYDDYIRLLNEADEEDEEDEEDEVDDELAENIAYFDRTGWFE